VNRRSKISSIGMMASQLDENAPRA